MIIGLHGTARSGKNTVASYLVDKYGYKEESFAYPLKQAVKLYTGVVSNSEDDREEKQSFSVRKDSIHEMARYFGFKKEIGEFYDLFKEQFSPYQTGSTDGTFEYEMSYREVLQILGTNVAREMNDTIWIDMLDKRLNGVPNSVVVTDVRFDNEAEYIYSKCGKVVGVEREGGSNLTEDTASHPSEKGISLVYLSGLILNNGTKEELFVAVEEELDSMFEERISDYREELEK